MAIVDHRYLFCTFDIWPVGVVYDGGAFLKCSIFQALESSLVPNGGVIIGDEVFPLKTYLMKPY
jgi:hypothetical protein